MSRLAALSAWQQVFAAGRPAQGEALPAWRSRDEVFTLGVASGEPRPDAVVIWTRLAPQPLQPDGGMPPRPVPVRWEVAADRRFTRVVRSGTAVADPERGHSVHVDVAGLQPGRVYFYRFEAGGQQSPEGRTRTAPAPDAPVSRLRMALASCQHYEYGRYAAHRHMADSDVDLVLFVGDYIYTSSARAYERVRWHPHRFEGAFSLRRVEDYRMHHAGYKLDAELRACHAAHPWLMVWDDHEVIADYTGDSADILPDRELFLAMRTAAYRAYFEHLPLSPHRAPVGPNMPMHGRYTWGQLAELWTVDTRQYRDPAVCFGRDAVFNGKLLWGCHAATEVGRSMLGAQQEAGLASGLAASTRDWKFIVQSTQFTPAPLRTPMGDMLYGDGWDAFPAARARLLDAIVQPRVEDVVLLGGDVHRHVAANVRLDPLDHDTAIIASEVVTSSVTSRGLSELFNSWMKRANPDILHMRSDERGYVLLDVTPAQLQVDYLATRYPVRTVDAPLHRQARYVVERGVPGMTKA